MTSVPNDEDMRRRRMLAALFLLEWRPPTEAAAELPAAKRQAAEPKPAAPTKQRARRLSPKRLAKWEAQWQAESEAES